jgi:hypothetical protein
MFLYNLQEETTTSKHHYAIMETIYHKAKKGAIIHLVLKPSNFVEDNDYKVDR